MSGFNGPGVPLWIQLLIPWSVWILEPSSVGNAPESVYQWCRDGKVESEAPCL